MEQGSILKWLKSEGDPVTRNSLLFELETDKAILEVPSPADGVLLKIMTATGRVQVEEIVGWVGSPGEIIAPEMARSGPAEVATPAPAAVPAPPPLSRPSSPSTPAARRRAAELGLEITSVVGSGPGGRITQEDVERAATSRRIGAEPPVAAGRGELARNVTLAWRTVPHIHISRRLEVDEMAGASERLRHRNLSVTDLLLFALSRTLPSFPDLTQTWNGDRLEQASATHIAIAVNTERGVMAPVIRDASSLTLEQIGARRRALASAARAHELKVGDLVGGVFTLTNLGMEGVDFFAPILNHPQTAILATGRMTEEPIVRDGSVRVGWRMWANLAIDHRVADGAIGARFLTILQEEVNRLFRMIQVSTEIAGFEIRNFS
jgi:pyruvate dehydrogenase E2 component (dihydrolipoamide acetyltransferase)